MAKARNARCAMLLVRRARAIERPRVGLAAWKMPRLRLPGVVAPTICTARFDAAGQRLLSTHRGTGSARAVRMSRATSDL